MRVVEHFIKGKRGPDKCEDALFISEHFIAVIDGVTSKSDFTYDGKTTGKLASEMIKEQLEGLEKEATVQQFLAKVNKEFETFYNHISFPYEKCEKGLQAVCVVYSRHQNAIWLIGDCQVSVDGKVYMNPKRSDDILAEFRSLILNLWDDEREIREEQLHSVREMIVPWILKSTAYANDTSTEYGYACINGESIPESLIRVIELDGEVSHEIILTSDGYPEVRKSLEETEAYLEEILRDDPNCYKKFKSTKGIQKGNISFDDRTYVKFYT